MEASHWRCQCLNTQEKNRIKLHLVILRVRLLIWSGCRREAKCQGSNKRVSSQNRAKSGSTATPLVASLQEQGFFCNFEYVCADHCLDISRVLTEKER